MIRTSPPTSQWFPSSFPWFGARDEAFPATWQQIFAMTTNPLNPICQLTHLSRKARAEGDEEEAKRMKAACGGFTPAVFCVGGRREDNIRALTQHCICDIDGVPSHMMPELKQLAALDPHSLLTFTTNSQHGIRTVFPWVGVNEDGEPVAPSAFVWNEKEETHAHFLERVLPWHSVAFRLGNEYFADLLGMDYDAHTSDAVRFSFYCHDAHATLNLHAMPFVVHESVVESIRRKERSRFIEEERHRKEKREDGSASPFELALRWVGRRLTYVRGHRNQFIVQCIYIVRDLGVSLAEAEAWADREFADYENEHTRHSIVRACYKKH